MKKLWSQFSIAFSFFFCSSHSTLYSIQWKLTQHSIQNFFYIPFLSMMLFLSSFSFLYSTFLFQWKLNSNLWCNCIITEYRSFIICVCMWVFVFVDCFTTKNNIKTTKAPTTKTTTKEKPKKKYYVFHHCSIITQKENSVFSVMSRWTVE